MMFDIGNGQSNFHNIFMNQEQKSRLAVGFPMEMCTKISQQTPIKISFVALGIKASFSPLEEVA